MNDNFSFLSPHFLLLNDLILTIAFLDKVPQNLNSRQQDKIFELCVARFFHRNAYEWAPDKQRKFATDCIYEF
jgi:hypothetical protein